MLNDISPDEFVIITWKCPNCQQTTDELNRMLPDPRSWYGCNNCDCTYDNVERLVIGKEWVTEAIAEQDFGYVSDEDEYDE